MRHNDYGFYRVSLSKFTLNPNKDERVYSLVDTNYIYRFLKDERKNVSGSSLPRYYKFYSDGRVAEFYNYNIDLNKDSILESKKGYMGYYSFDGKNIIVQFYRSNSNASELSIEKIFIENDAMVSIKDYPKDNAQIKSFFIKENIPKNIQIITKPDW